MQIEPIHHKADPRVNARLANQYSALVRLARNKLIVGGDVGEAMREICEVASNTLQVARVGVWMFGAENKKIECVELFTRETSEHSQGGELFRVDYPIYFNYLECNRAIVADDACSCEATREFTTSYLKPYGISSLLDAPIRRRGELVGVVCHEHIGVARVWQADEIQFSASIADLIALALETANNMQAEAALRENEANFRALAENANDGILIGVDEGKYAFANQRCAEITGYSVVELKQHSIWDIVHPDERGEVKRKFYARLHGNEPTRQYESKLLHKNGTTVAIEVTAARTIWQSRPAILAIVRDITRRKKQEQQLLRMQDDLEHRVELRTAQLRKTHEQLLHSEKLSAVGKLAASVAHEFNNPLFGIRNVLERVEERGASDDTTRHLVQLAIGECERVADLIRKLQDFNRPSSEEFIWLDLKQAVQDIVSLCERKALARGIRLRTEYAAALPRVFAIEDQLKQVILNLINNAEEAIGEGGGDIEITIQSDQAAIQLAVADSGSGIDADKLPFIFEPFFTTKSAVKGTGLGLSVTHGIVKRHGGQIAVSTSKFGGAQIEVRLPIGGANVG